MTVRIASPIKVNYRQRHSDIEAWFNAGLPFEEWPDWVRSHYVNCGVIPLANKAGHYAVRDEEGFFWRWFSADDFRQRYERITP